MLSSAPPDLLDQKPWRGDPAACVLTSFLGDSDAGRSLGTAVLDKGIKTVLCE